MFPAENKGRAGWGHVGWGKAEERGKDPQHKNHIKQQQDGTVVKLCPKARPHGQGWLRPGQVTNKRELGSSQMGPEGSSLISFVSAALEGLKLLSCTYF